MQFYYLTKRFLKLFTSKFKDSDISGITAERWIQASKAGLEAVMKYGIVEPGDRTLVTLALKYHFALNVLFVYFSKGGCSLSCLESFTITFETLHQ